MKRKLFSRFLICFTSFLFGINHINAQQHSKSFDINKNYIVMPVDDSKKLQLVDVLADGKSFTEFRISLTTEAPVFWSTFDVRKYKGKTVTFTIDKEEKGNDLLNKFYQSDDLPDRGSGYENIYEEMFRPRFHYSPRVGWVNDPNGMVYYNGTYHFFYQYNPHSLKWNNMQWGYATSSNLVNWTEQSVPFFAPYKSEAFSGSGTVDWNNTTGLQTGEHPPILLYYTESVEKYFPVGKRKTPQNLIYSIDGGKSWIPYEKNPILAPIKRNNGIHNPDRDPIVRWYAPSNHWIMLLHEHNAGFRIYKSNNGLDWAFASSFRLKNHREVPDILFMDVENEPGVQKWVFLSGYGNHKTGNNTHYVVGKFDGTTFTPEQNSIIIDSGYGNYSTQTFSDAPNNRHILMGWHSRLFSSLGYKGMPSNAQFRVPWELSLHKVEKEYRIQRLPVKELATLRNSNHQWLDLDIKTGTTFQSGIDQYELDIEAEIKAAPNGSVSFILAGATINYDFSTKTLKGFGRSTVLLPEKGVLKFRILLDRTSIELFANDGKTVMTGLFTPNFNKNAFDISAEGTNIAVKYLKIYKMGDMRKRDVQNSSGPIDDADANNTYSGNWQRSSEGIYFKNGCSVTTKKGDYIECAFIGSEISWYGLKNVDLGFADIYIDNKLVKKDVDCYSKNRAVQLLFQQKNLSVGSHTIRILNTGKKNVKATAAYLVHDYFSTDEVSKNNRINDLDSENTYSGNWKTFNSAIYYKNDCNVSLKKEEYVETNFSGTSVSWFGLKNTDLGYADVYIDGVLTEENIDCYGTKKGVYNLFSKTGLSAGAHTIKIVNTGEKNEASKAAYLVHDYFLINDNGSNGLDDSCSFVKQRGKATDITSYGSDTYFIGLDNYLYKSDGKGAFINLDKTTKIKRIDANKLGVWAIGIDNKVLQYQQGKWLDKKGTGIDIGAGENKIFVVGTDEKIREYEGKYQYSDPLPNGSGTDIDVSKENKPWVRGLDGKLYQWAGNSWKEKGNLRIKDVGINPDDTTVFVAANDQSIHIYTVGNSFKMLSGKANRITVDRGGNPWVVTPIDDIFKRVCIDSGARQVAAKTIAEDEEDMLKLYPNPASKILNIQFSPMIEKNATISIYSFTGSLLDKISLAKNSQSIRIEHLNPGIYFIEIQNGSSITNAKFVKELHST